MKACEKFAAGLILGTSLAAQALAESKYSPWGPPVNLGCAVNSASADIGPGISKDGLSLYFGSSRPDPGASGDFDLYVAQRPSRDAPWGRARNLGNLGPGINPGINSPAADAVVSFSRDGHWMFFNSNRAGGFGSVDIWTSFRDHVHDDSAWGPPSNLPGVNSAGFDGGASYFENEDGSAPLLFFNRRSEATQANDIHVSELQPDGTFGNVRPVPELNSLQEDQRPSIRFDGLEIFFFSNRSGSNDIWVATRNSPNDGWGTPVNLGSVVNTGAAEQMPYISPDARTLYFASDRPGGCGGLDLYMTTRTKREDGDKAN
jgi:WD40 repeat protein